MSDFASPDLARLWLDGDAFRAPADTALPADIFAATLTSWEAFGGIKAGFTLTTDQDTTDVDVWNNKSGAPYKRIKQPPKPTIALRPVDYSKATVLTLLRGGSVAETATASGIWEMIPGDTETFAFIMRVIDGDHTKAYYVPVCELANIPEEVMGADDDVEGFDIELGPLAPSGGGLAVRKFLSENPLAA
jgi:hypothetical protein